MDEQTSNTRRAKRLVALALGLGAGISLGLVAESSVGSFHRGLVLPLVVLAVLAIAAANFEIDVGSHFAISGDVMVATASLVVFRQSGFVLGPALIGILGGLYLVQIKERDFAAIAINMAIGCVSLIAGAVLFDALAPAANPPTLVLVAAMAAGASLLLLVNAVLLSWSISVVRKRGYLPVLRQVSAYDAGAAPFALLGLGVGWTYLNFGPAVLPLLVVPILIARQTFAVYLDLKGAQEQTIETLILALEAKDRYTAGHVQRVATFCEYIGSEFRFGPRRMERLRYAALMHDIGKLIVPNQILNKPGKLTESEFERVQKHEFVSVELLRRIDFLAPVAGDTTTEAATAAVEESGLVEPAIIHVADAFDAMTSTRSYRRALSQETAFDELRKGAGTQFNAKCVDALIAAIEQRGEHYGDGHEADEHEWAVAPPTAGTGSAGLGDLVTEEQAAGS